MAEPAVVDSVDVNLPWFKGRATGKEAVLGFMLIIIMLFSGGSALLSWSHDANSAERNTTIVKAMVDQTNAIKAQTLAQQEANCLARLSPEQKKDQELLALCRNVGRGN